LLSAGFHWIKDPSIRATGARQSPNAAPAPFRRLAHRPRIIPQPSRTSKFVKLPCGPSFGAPGDRAGPRSAPRQAPSIRFDAKRRGPRRFRREVLIEEERIPPRRIVVEAGVW